MANGHGGDRIPRNPATHSGPGAFSQRTDGAPSRAAGRISGQPFGEGQQTNRLLRQAGQTAGGSPASATNGPQQGPQAAPGQPLPDVFAPTQRPGEPLTAGAPGGPTDTASKMLPSDPDALLRALYAAHPHPDLRRMLQRRDRA